MSESTGVSTSIFRNKETVGLVLHVQIDKFRELKDFLNSTSGLKIVYQRRENDGKLWITDEDPRKMKGGNTEQENQKPG